MFCAGWVWFQLFRLVCIWLVWVNCSVSCNSMPVLILLQQLPDVPVPAVSFANGVTSLANKTPDEVWCSCATVSCQWAHQSRLNKTFEGQGNLWNAKGDKRFKIKSISEPSMNSLDDLKISVVYMPTSLENNRRNPIEKVTEISIVHDQFQNLDLSHVTRASTCYDDFPKIEEIDNFNLYIWRCNNIYIEFQEAHILLIMNHTCVIFNPFITHYATYSVVQPIFYFWTFCHPWRSIETCCGYLVQYFSLMIPVWNYGLLANWIEKNSRRMICDCLIW